MGEYKVQVCDRCGAESKNDKFLPYVIETPQYGATIMKKRNSSERVERVNICKKCGDAVKEFYNEE